MVQSPSAELLSLQCAFVRQAARMVETNLIPTLSLVAALMLKIPSYMPYRKLQPVTNQKESCLQASDVMESQ